ncbi:hypothetical protein TWF694_002029 [Orbilia ellipsospora]|uniref:F-box domain-containing protein n=1 Tax=Orbilia ellipsospora TaxID=2528407 RepID=A0AAV9X782_9PEZI
MVSRTQLVLAASASMSDSAPKMQHNQHSRASNDSGVFLTPIPTSTAVKSPSILSHRESLDLPDPIPPILNLPLDIFSMITGYLSMADLVSLSLTTKFLRPFCPESSLPLNVPSRTLEERCISRMHLRFLPVHQPTKKKEHKYMNFLFSSSRNYKCPFCSHNLCPPSCDTALFLDSSTGIFYPHTLYNPSKAVFKYCPEMVSLTTEANNPSGGYTHKLLSRTTSQESHRRPHKFVYSTIWCSHHRCPRNLLTLKPSKNPFAAGNNLGYGASLFLEEYLHNWGESRYREHIKTPSLPTITSPPIWAHVPGGRELVGIPIRGGQEVYARTVYEYSFYESVCRHCGFVCTHGKHPFLENAVFDSFCGCHEDGGAEAVTPNTTGKKVHTLGGCKRCGVASVKFTVVKAFDDPKGRSMCVATEVGVKNTFLGTGQKVQRLQALNATSDKEYLEIVRGRDLVDMPAPPRVGILDLPSHVLRRIMVYAGEYEPVGIQNQPYDLLQTSYIFGKYFYGADIQGWQRSFDIIKENFCKLEQKVLRQRQSTGS